MQTEKEVKPLTDYYQRGYVTGRGLMALSMSWWSYAEERGISFHQRFAKKIAERLIKESLVYSRVSLGLTENLRRHAYTKKMPRVKDRNRPLVDPVYADAHLDEIRLIVADTREGVRRSRSEEEAMQHREQILRIRQEDGSYLPISMGEALSRVIAIARKRPIPGLDTLSIAEEVAVRSIPFLEGQVGNFWDFTVFAQRRLRLIRSKVAADYRKPQKAKLS